MPPFFGGGGCGCDNNKFLEKKKSSKIALIFSKTSTSICVRYLDVVSVQQITFLGRKKKAAIFLYFLVPFMRTFWSLFLKNFFLSSRHLLLLFTQIVFLKMLIFQKISPKSGHKIIKIYQKVQKHFRLCFVVLNIIFCEHKSYSKLPPRIVTFKLPKGCHFLPYLGFGNLKKFLQRFSKKKKISKKLFFSSPKKNKKTYILPTPVLPQRMPLGVPREKKWQSLGGGGVCCKYLTKKVSDTFPSAYFFRERTGECQKNFSLRGGVPKFFFSKVLRCFSDKKNKL